MNKIFTTGKVKEINVEQRMLTAYASTRDMDRDGDVIVPDAWRNTIREFTSVPLVWAHDYRIPPVGKATSFEIDGRGLKFTAQFATTEFANEIWGLYRDGFLNSFSVGFQPKQWSDNEGRDGKTFTDAELLEISAVPVPANPYATVERGVPVLAFKSVDSFAIPAEVETKRTTERDPAATVAVNDTADESEPVQESDPVAEVAEDATPTEADGLTAEDEAALEELLANIADVLASVILED